MMKNKIKSLKILFFVLLVPIAGNSQDCGCRDHFIWIKKTFEENDAGFAYALDKKGEQAYTEHNEAYLKKIKGIEDLTECLQILRGWLTFFRSGHHSIRQINTQYNSSTLSDEEIIERFKDWESLDVDLGTFRESLKNITEPGFEGIWESPPYKIGITRQGDQYKGFIIEADGVYWREGQIKLIIHEKNNELNATYYLRDHSSRTFDNVELLGNNYLKMGYITLTRTYPEYEVNESIERHFRLIGANQTFIESVSDNTLLLRIPSFSGSRTERINKVIKQHRDEILSTENLIIDLRNNGGGSDNSYEEILPIVYTDPIRRVNFVWHSTPLNNRRWENFLSDPHWSKEGKERVRKSLNKLNANLGEFVNLEDSKVNVTRFDTVYQYPKNIGIIINGNNASSVEQFLLAARQSRKVKLFGTPTFGALDFSVMYFVESPCKTFQLGYTVTKSLRIPEMAIDGIGIQPDYYLDESIPEYKWIDFIVNTFDY